MTDNDFRQFNGAFDSAMEPDNAFAERLQKRMRAEAPPPPASDRPSVVASPPRPQEQMPTQPLRSHPLYMVAAMLVVIALAAASVIQLAPRVLEPQFAAQSVATLPAEVSTTPGADVVLTAAPVNELKSVSYNHVHGDNLIAVRYVPPTDAQRLLSYNVQSGDILWEQDVTGSEHFVFGDNIVVAVSYIQREPSETERLPQFDALVSYDLKTGEELWARSISDWQMKHGWETVEIAGDTVVFLQEGEIIGIDAASGETIWQSDYDMAEAQEDGWVQPPSIAGINDNVYVAQSNGSVEVFDLASGTRLDQFNLPASIHELNPVSLQLLQVPAGLLVVADTYGEPGPRTTLYVVEPENGELVWERSLDHSGLVDVATDGSIAIATHTWESPPLLLRLFGQDGHSTSALTWLDPDGGVILETDRVELPDMVGLVAAGNGKFICGTTEQFTCFDRSGTRYTVDVTFTWDAAWVGDTLLILTDRGVMRVDIP